MQKQSQWKVASPIGNLYLTASKKGLQGVSFRTQNAPMKKSKILARAQRQLKEYFSGKRRNFDLKLDLSGTPFQQRVWKELLRIPHGRTVSYKDVAVRIRNKKAVRAVGTANGKNPLCIIVPCHRVFAHNGSLGGYSGGLNLKKRLLNLEGLPKFSF